MRIVNEIIHPECKITIFSWNSKYLIKFERGLIEQTYKVPETEVSGDEEINKLVRGELLKKVLVRFNEMEDDLIQALDSIYE